ncbi:MAG: DNA translocase FtsK, partial [Firmicutes bacterium]|nr:DNA translocase FtsK [Bacillota bacterium]
VSAAVANVTRGPTVTRYDLELDAGVKLNKLTNLAGDLALSLGVTSVRIAPIPDKVSTVGIEVPNKLISMVYLRDILESPAFRDAPSKLSFAIGKDIAGNSVVGNISKLPHMLIAGTTGSGKSVCMNSLILSLLYKSAPDEVRLIMIDPKMVELGIYNGIPHLYVPVVTDPKKAAGSLQWAVVEMLKRYRLFSEAGVRDLAGYNAYQKKKGLDTIPQVVIVIDELADLMLVASKEVEESICRVAQMGRASGMHLIIATQRPSADVITGLMKANIPSRIAFAVSSALESRIILDTQGAEKLIGSGDMLYSPLGSGKPKRVQGAFVSDEEREKVINFVKQRCDAQYDESIIHEIDKNAEEKDGKGANGKQPEVPEPQNNYDELLPQAVEVIFETKQASVSMLQRRLKLGYSRAARLVDQMEEAGVVGPFEGSKPRQILITKQQWQEMQLIHGTAPLGPVEQSFADYKDVPAEEWE